MNDQVRTLPDGSTITYTAEGRVWNTKDGGRLLSTGYGPWINASELLPAQTCPSCGAEHPGERCSAYDGDLFGGDS